MPISTDQKSAMALGRKQSQIVNKYLTVIADNKPRRGRQRTVESIQKRLDMIEERLHDAAPVVALRLISEQRSLKEEQQRLAQADSIKELETQFVEVAREFGERKGIRRSDWREFGVPNDVLEKAGI